MTPHLKYVDAGALSYVPDPDRLVVAGAGHIDAVRGEGQSLHPALVALQHVDGLTIAGIPKTDGLIPGP